MALSRRCTKESPGGLVKTTSAGLTCRVSVSLACGGGSDFVSNSFPGEADAAEHGPHFDIRWVRIS